MRKTMAVSSGERVWRKATGERGEKCVEEIWRRMM
jgi:hypothetical protein